ncbi:MAG: NAD(P)/FAD-dependent oxidoreductase [Roseinatronobacter sp.]
MQQDATTIVIGAGMAGIACARALATAGARVQIIDKGRGIGGRMATRRVQIGAQELRFDHGAQYLRPKDPALCDLLRAAGAAPWPCSGLEGALVGVPGASALPRALADGLSVVQGVTVTGLARTGNGWQVETSDGARAAARVVLAIPAPQARALVADFPRLGAALDAVEMAPCLTLMAAFDAGSPQPFVTRRQEDAPLAWVAQDSTKPGRAAGPVTWVAQAGENLSRALLELAPETMTAALLDALCALIGARPEAALHASAHRWRYAFTSRALGQPFLRDTTGTLWLGGDWALGAKAEHAHASGTAIARDILEQDHAGAADVG